MECRGVSADRLRELSGCSAAIPKVVRDAKLRSDVEDLRSLSAKCCLEQGRNVLLWMLEICHNPAPRMALVPIVLTPIHAMLNNTSELRKLRKELQDRNAEFS